LLDPSAQSSARDQLTAAGSATDAVPNSPTRDALRRVVAKLEAASFELDEAQKPARRLSATVAEFEAAERNLLSFVGRQAPPLAAWLAEGATGPRPERAAATLDAERLIAQLNRDSAAARVALPAVQRVRKPWPNACARCTASADETAYWTAADAARVFAQRWRAKLVTRSGTSDVS